MSRATRPRTVVQIAVVLGEEVHVVDDDAVKVEEATSLEVAGVAHLAAVKVFIVAGLKDAEERRMKKVIVFDN